MTRTLVLANNKGGAGRTTSAINLADNLAKMGKKILLIDCDPDICATQWLGFEPEGMTTLYDVLIDVKHGLAKRGDKPGPIVHYIGNDEKRIRYPGVFDLLVGSPRVTDAPAMFDGSLTSQPREAQVFEKVVHYLITTHCREYDYVIFDTTSLHGRLAAAILAAVQWVVVSMQVEAMYKRGVLNLLPTIKATNAKRREYAIGDEIRLAGLLGCKVPAGEMAAAQTFFASLPTSISHFRTIIPYSTPAHEAPEACLPISVYAPGDPAAVAYAAFTHELEARINA